MKPEYIEMNIEKIHLIDPKKEEYFLPLDEIDLGKL